MDRSPTSAYVACGEKTHQMEWLCIPPHAVLSRELAVALGHRCARVTTLFTTSAPPREGGYPAALGTTRSRHFAPTCGCRQGGTSRMRRM